MYFSSSFYFMHESNGYDGSVSWHTLVFLINESNFGPVMFQTLVFLYGKVPKDPAVIFFFYHLIRQLSLTYGCTTSLSFEIPTSHTASNV